MKPASVTTQKVDSQPIPSQLNKSNPFRQAVTNPTPSQKVTANHKPFTNAKPSIQHTPAMSQPKPYEVLFKCLRDTWFSRDEAAAGAKAALASSKIITGTSVIPVTTVCGNQVNSSTTSNQSFYNSKKLLHNQQQQTIALLAQVPSFNGIGSTKFEYWIPYFERVVDTTEFQEGRKIKLLGSKLLGSAEDCITTFQLHYPRETMSFIKV